jgi:hypothetical protein
MCGHRSRAYLGDLDSTRLFNVVYSWFQITRLTPIFMNKMLALKFVLSIVSRHLIGQF